MKRTAVLAAASAAFAALAFLGTAPAASAAGPNLGPNVVVFTPAMAQADIQAKLDQISAQQVPNQFGTQRYAVFFEPGTYGSAATPLDFQLGYYTQLAGLGAQPGDTVINGAINVFNQCDSSGSCVGSNNFFRSVSNLTLNVHLPATPPAYSPNPGEDPGCLNTNDLFGVSQASPVRRTIINGAFFLQDYCGAGYVSGGFFADDELNGFTCNCGQQQWITRNTDVNNNWSNGVWNQVFMGDVGAPATSFGPGTNQYTTLPSTPVSEEEPFLTEATSGNWNVFVPAVQHNSVGPSYASGMEAGTTLPVSKFFIATPSTNVLLIDAALALGKNLILTPGVYNLPAPILVSRPNTIVLGLGFATLVPQNGTVALQTLEVPGVKISGLIIDAGVRNSPALMSLGLSHLAPGTRDANNPTVLQDVFFRIGGATPGKATTTLVVNTNNTILDDVWAWRADHGNGVGWTSNTADTGVVVNGDNVSAYGLFVEHYQKNEVIWNGQNGEDVFFQNEMPYDVPSQAAWMSSPTQNGYPAFFVSPKVTSFQGYGMGSYSFFNQGVDIHASMAFQTPTTAGDAFTDLDTVFLSTAGSGAIDTVIDGVGSSSNISNADVPQDVLHYP
jgi:hypothetical protein